MRCLSPHRFLGVGYQVSMCMERTNTTPTPNKEVIPKKADSLCYSANCGHERI